jgi:hypothetical protein
MTDIVERLRLSYCGDATCVACEAADEIERLREALHTIAEVCPKDDCRHVARRALEAKQDDSTCVPTAGCDDT